MLVAGLMAIVLVLGWWWRVSDPATDSVQHSAKEPTLGDAQPREKPPAIPATLSSQSLTLARAVAAVGAYDDGRRATLDDLPAEVQALIEPARLLLGATPRLAAPALPMVLPDGTVTGVGADPTPRRPAETAEPVHPTDGVPTLAERERARAVDGRLVARSLSTTAGKAPPPTRGDRVKEILEPDAWMAVPYDPARVAGEPLVITNRSLGEYVLRLDAGDYGRVRLNGGLVVPGRFYLMEGTMTIHSDVPVGVIIRPLGVVHGYYEQPVRPPSANG